jgi:hypothetical protein
VSNARKLDLKVADLDNPSGGGSSATTTGGMGTSYQYSVDWGTAADLSAGETGFTPNFGTIDATNMQWLIDAKTMCNTPSGQALSYLAGVVLVATDKYWGSSDVIAACPYTSDPSCKVNKVKAVVQVKKTGGICRFSP